MDSTEMKNRTMQFGLRVIRLVSALPKHKASDVIAYQLLKAGTSVGANYRAACRARSTADFLSKLGVVEEEADESLYWINMIVAAGLMPARRVADLTQEGEEILSIIVATIRTTKTRQRAPKAALRGLKSEIRNPKSEI